MIEKPKRPKQPNIQDRQPPRTLQELINRYDLDNTKIYDFLDELVELLNTERKSIDTSINDLNNNKVNKSGDEMTGQLNMQSNSLRFGTSGNIFWKEDGFGDKFRILPYFSGSGSDNKLVIQSTNGDAGTDPQNWKDLVYIHADTGLIELAGRLLFNNKDSYDAIRKTRTFNDEDYQVSVGVGGNMSARMEFVKVPDNVLSSVEARSDGIYNGVSGNKLLEVEKVVSVTSDYQIADNSCFKSQDFINIGINIYNENSTYGTYSWVQLARLPVGSRPSGEKYITGAGFGAGWSNAIAVPIMIDANGYISVYLRTSDLKRIIANGIITL